LLSPKKIKISSTEDVPGKEKGKDNNLGQNTPNATSHISISGSKLPKKIRVLGYSAGGGVAAYVSMILDGIA
jgi:hypothetical protein